MTLATLLATLHDYARNAGTCLDDLEDAELEQLELQLDLALRAVTAVATQRFLAQEARP